MLVAMCSKELQCVILQCDFHFAGSMEKFVWKTFMVHCYYFKSLLRHTSLTSDVKKAVDVNNIEFLLTVFKGHVLAKACEILEISTLDGVIHIPPALTHSSLPAIQQLQFVKSIASNIVVECTLH